MLDRDFLSGLMQMRQQVAEGDRCWSDVSQYRESNGRVPYTSDSLRRYFGFYDDLKNDGWMITPPDSKGATYRETTEINAKGEKTSDKLIALFEGEKDSPEALLRAHGYSPDCFALVSARSSVWNAASQEPDGKTLYSSKIVVKPKADIISLEDAAKYFEGVAERAPTVRGYSYQNYQSGAKCLVPCFFDVHFGRLAWYGETGDSYDYKIATNRLIQSACAYKEKYAGQKFEKIIFVLGQDFFNSASNGFTTSGKHEQDNDTRYQKIFEKGVEALIQVVEIFAEMAPVDVVLCQGNHSFYEEYYCASVLAAYFRNDERVSVDKTPRTRKYRLFGNTLLGITHGSEEGDRIYGLMQTEAPDDWAKATQRIWLTGHFHTLKVVEKMGVEVYTIPSLTSGDAWTIKEGFAAKKRTMAFVFDKQIGLTDMSFVNI